MYMPAMAEASLQDRADTTGNSGTGNSGTDNSSTGAFVSQANIFSCINCRRRKIRCNRTNPCINCAKAGQTCSFPPPRRAARHDPQAEIELRAKLHRMESIINSLQSSLADKDALIQKQQHKQPHDQMRDREQEHEGGQQIVHEAPSLQLEQQKEQQQKQEQHHQRGRTPEVDEFYTRPRLRTTSDMGPPFSHSYLSDSTRLSSYSKEAPIDPSRTPGSASSPSVTSSKSAGLIRDEGRKLYVGGSFWGAFSAQSDDHNHQSATDFDEEEELFSPQDAISASPFAEFLLTTTGASVKHQHPSPENRQKLWRVFREKVDPVLKILHIPTIEPQLNEWLYQDDITGMSTGINALLWAIYFAAASSMDLDVCRGLLNLDPDEFISRARAGGESALFSAKLLNTDDLLVLQAFIIYLTTLRFHAPRMSWTLCSLAFRLLQSVGAHREGVSSSLPIFEAEMFKRLIWHLCLLECGAAEDCGCDPTIFEISSFNVPLPRNVNDSELSESMTTEPVESDQWTESTLLILWGEITQLWRMFYDTRHVPEGEQKTFQAMDEAEKAEFISEKSRKIEKRFSTICSPLIPLQWVVTILGRLLILEFKIAASRPIERYAEMTRAECDDLFTGSVECIELSNKLLTDPRSVRWVWLFKSFTLWHPLAFVLTELKARPLRKDYQKAWRVVEQAMVTRWQSPHNSWGHQWRAMLHLYETAQLAKASETRRRRESVRSRSDTASLPAAPAMVLPAPQQHGYVWPQVLNMNHQQQQTHSTTMAHAQLFESSTPVLSLSLSENGTSRNMDTADVFSADLHSVRHQSDALNMDPLQIIDDYDMNDTLHIDSSHETYIQADFTIHDTFTADFG